MRAVANIPLAFAPLCEIPGPANDAMGEVSVGGLKTACLSRQGLSRLMLTDCLAAREIPGHHPKLVFATNGHAIATAARDATFRAVFGQADIVHADGQAAVFASRLTATPIPERSATTDFIHDAAEVAAMHGLRFFLLGATEEANAKAAEILKATYPGLQIVGRRHGYFGLDEEDEVCDEINLTKPDVIWVGLSVPREYEFAVRNKQRLGAGWLVTCGGCYNFITGAYARAPRWMQAAGLEWLHRLIREPKRLFWRYAVTNPVAIFLLLTRTNALAAEESSAPARKALRSQGRRLTKTPAMSLPLDPAIGLARSGPSRSLAASRLGAPVARGRTLWAFHQRAGGDVGGAFPRLADLCAQSAGARIRTLFVCAGDRAFLHEPDCRGPGDPGHPQRS